MTLLSEKKVSFVEQDGTTSVMCHVEAIRAIRQELVIQVFNSFLHDVPLLRNMFFDSSFCSTPRSWVPGINTESLLFGQSVGHVVVVESSTLRRMESCLAGASRNASLTLFTSTV